RFRTTVAVHRNSAAFNLLWADTLDRKRESVAATASRFLDHRSHSSGKIIRPGCTDQKGLDENSLNTRSRSARNKNFVINTVFLKDNFDGFSRTHCANAE